MTPKEKAKELVNKFYNCRVLDFDAAKQCALIAVDEIIISMPMIPAFIDDDNGVNYWQEVRQEIEKL